MSNDLFEILEEQSQQREYKRACLLAFQRAQTRCGSFLRAASSNEEFESRLALAGGEITDCVTAAAREENAPELAPVLDAVYAHLRDTYGGGDILRGTPQNSDVAPGGERNETEDDDPDEEAKPWEKKEACASCKCDDCTGDNCGCCAECGGKKESAVKTAEPIQRRNPYDVIREMSADIAQLEQQLEQAGIQPFTVQRDMDEEAQYGAEEPYSGNEIARGVPEQEGEFDHLGQVKIAEGVTPETGDTYNQEREDLPKADASGLSEDATVNIDRASAGDENHTSQQPIDVGSVEHALTNQDPDEHADYTKALEEYGVTKRVDADTPMQPEFTTAPNTAVFPNKDQANPVTSKWHIVS